MANTGDEEWPGFAKTLSSSNRFHEAHRYDNSDIVYCDIIINIAMSCKTFSSSETWLLYGGRSDSLAGTVIDGRETGTDEHLIGNTVEQPVVASH